MSLFSRPNWPRRRDGVVDEQLLADAALAADLVREAGQLALELRRDGVRTETKTSISDVVTSADRAAERLVEDHLAAFRPDDGVLGEEGARQEGSTGRRWVIDPIDGTYNFVHGLDWWCSAIALTVDDEVALGAVYHPTLDVLYIGGPELPPMRDDQPLPVLTDVGLAQTCVATYLHPTDHEGEIARAFGRAVGQAATVRMLGSGTLDQMAVAQGQLGVLFQHSVPAWDWLPGVAIVRGVGGVSAQVEAAGVTWSVSGAPTAVAESVAALADR